MEDTFRYFRICTAMAGGAVGSLIGGYDMFAKILIIMILLDYTTGVLKAIYNKKLNSSIGFKGIIKKIMLLIIVAVSVQLDCILGTENALRIGTIFFFIANEGISILENASQMDLPVPKQIKEALEKINNEKNNK